MTCSMHISQFLTASAIIHFDDVLDFATATKDPHAKARGPWHWLTGCSTKSDRLSQVLLLLVHVRAGRCAALAALVGLARA